jgi:hypothetical protein
MIWLMLSIVALVILAIFAVYIEPDVIVFTSDIAGVPHINMVWMILGSVLFLLLGLLFVYFDSRQALVTLASGNREYVVLPRRIGNWAWNDTVNAHTYSGLTGFIILLAKIVIFIFILKYIFFGILWLLSMIIPIVNSSFFSDIQLFVVQWMKILFELFIDKYGLLTFIFSIIILCAEWLHVREQTFYDDYAIMQHQHD